MQKIRELFNFRLYLEGLKKIKLIGIAALIVTTALCAIVPIIYIADGGGYREGLYSISINEFAAPVCVIMLFAPFFVSSMFSFLNTRRDSDFYHSIPYKRQSVYTSFLLAALTWCLGIIVSAVLCTTLLWSVAPRTTFEFYYIPLIILAAFCACMLLMSFMALAMCLTGTATTNIFIFGLVACFFRSVCLCFTYALENTVFILDLSETVLRFTGIVYFFPIALLGGSFGMLEPETVYTNVPLHIYTVVISIALFVLALWLYVRRRSEMATKSAPTRRLQHVYRIAFTTPFVLIMFTFIAIELMGNDSMDFSFYIFMCFVIGIVYFLYELITTKSLKNMLKSAPYLLILLVVGVGFLASVGLLRVNVLSKTYEPEEIKSVIISHTGSSIYSEDNRYEELKTRNIKVNDPKVLEYVSDALDYSIDCVGEGTYSRRSIPVGYDGGKEIYERYVFTKVKIELKQGGTLTRKLKISESDYADMIKCAQNTEQYSRAYLQIPEPKSLYSIHWQGIDDEDMRFVYETFYEEYMSMTDEQKRSIKNVPATELCYLIECYGRENFVQYSYDMIVSQRTPRTLNALAAAMAEVNVTHPFNEDAGEISSYEASKRLLSKYSETDGKFDVDTDDKHRSITYNFSYTLYDASGKNLGSFSVDYSTTKALKAAKHINDAFSDGAIRTRYNEGDCVIAVDMYYYSSEMRAVNTAKGTYTEQISNVRINTQLVLFCDSNVARRLEPYVYKDDEYYYVNGDVSVKEDYYYYD